MSLWKSDDLALAIDQTTLSDRLTVIVVSAVYRGCAIPVAWTVMPGNKRGKWIEPTPELLSVAIPARMRVIAMADRGLRIPRLWEKIRSLGWHPYMRQSINATFRPDGGTHAPRRLVSAPGNAVIARGTAFMAKSKRTRGTIIAAWAEGQSEPWIVLTDLESERAGASWHALRFWIEVGFKALKSVGWQWQKTRRLDPARVERHWPVLSVATILAQSRGSRAEDAQAQKKTAGALRSPPKVAPQRRRSTSALQLGLAMLRRLPARGGMWRRVWLLPEPWPPPPDGMKVAIYGET